VPASDAANERRQVGVALSLAMALRVGRWKQIASAPGLTKHRIARRRGSV